MTNPVTDLHNAEEIHKRWKEGISIDSSTKTIELTKIHNMSKFQNGLSYVVTGRGGISAIMECIEHKHWNALRTVAMNVGNDRAVTFLLELVRRADKKS